MKIMYLHTVALGLCPTQIPLLCFSIPVPLTVHTLGISLHSSSNNLVIFSRSQFYLVTCIIYLSIYTGIHLYYNSLCH